ncbi:MAG: hypothetical protein IPK60_08600 [Sandaracinaceae bacterium]|nr:hypothetical protein [Sandaracinaceae bacterium]
MRHQQISLFAIVLTIGACSSSPSTEVADAGTVLDLTITDAIVVAPDAGFEDAGPLAESTIVDHDEFPVVITGDNLRAVSGVATDELVFFRWHADAWEAVPFQIDERRSVLFHEIYGTCGSCVQNDSTTAGLVYADGNTFTGSDPNPRVDEDDEIALMVKDFGGNPTSTVPPAGVDADFVVRFAVRDGTAAGYVFAFRDSSHATTRSTGDYVTYDFGLTSGDYRTTYDFRGIDDNGTEFANPENSTVTAASYTRHFSSRWISDGVSLIHDGVPGPNLIEMHNVQFAPGVCSRSVATFASGEGAYVANIDGPVRAIRDHLGSNSGPITEGIYRFYERSEEIEMRLRVHQIGGVMDLIDYSDAAKGMSYSDSVNDDLSIDGNADEYVPGALEYEVVSGTQGSLTHALQFETNITGLSMSSYYLDEDPAVTEPQCTGDDAAIGVSGPIIASMIPATDPRPVRGSSSFFLRTHRFTRYADYETSRSEAAALAGRFLAPLSIHAVAVTVPVVACGDGICQSSESTASCATDCEGSTIACGNGRCEAPEDDYACPADCAAASAVCGDTVCNGSETHASCARDCEVLICGDGACRTGETASSCAADCVSPLSTCGDFSCEGPAETTSNCAFDCVASCGDATCNGGETQTSCSDDCGTPS